MLSSPGSEGNPAAERGRVTADATHASAAEQAPDDPHDDLSVELEEARSQLAAAEDRYLRARADLENYRKRADRELERRLVQQRDELLREWLEVLDTVQRALALEAHHPELASGFRELLDQLDGILARHGVTRFGEPGERFDAERHEAVGVIPSRSHPAGTIVDVARSGYAADGRLLRPAQVIVARPADDGD
jgi:molecular chaperone GrpE